MPLNWGFWVKANRNNKEEKEMIEFFIMVTIYLDGAYYVAYKEYKTLEHCEKARELREYEKIDPTTLIVCKKILIHTSKNNPFPR